MKVNLWIIGTLVFAFLAAAAGAQTAGVDQWAGDGFTADERQEIYGNLLENRSGRAVQDVVIVDTTRPNAYFGMYRTSQMTAPGWDLYERTFDWATGNMPHATVMVWLATYNGTLDPQYSAEKDGIAVYNHLTTTMGIPAGNVHVAHQTTIETGNFAGYDIVLYTNTYSRDATNVMNQNIPFVTTCAGETDEMGIGTGANTMHSSRDYAYIFNNAHPVTAPYSIGRFTLAANMWMDASEASGNGRVLITAEAAPLVVDTALLSAGVGGICNFSLEAGSANAGKGYLLVAGITGTTPGTLLPGGLTTIPINRDWFTDFVLTHMASPRFTGFTGILSGSGSGTAVFNTLGPIHPYFIGKTLVFAYATTGTWDYASNAVTVDILP
jgi:hypothetical protein